MSVLSDDIRASSPCRMYKMTVAVTCNAKKSDLHRVPTASALSLVSQRRENQQQKPCHVLCLKAKFASDGRAAVKVRSCNFTVMPKRTYSTGNARHQSAVLFL
jgi:hypothetical protein